MRFIITSLALSVGLIAGSAATPASAEILYPWCRQPSDGGNYCGYSSEAQCQQNSGHGSFCIQNPRYVGPAAAAPAKRRSR